jgi:ABC-2 type transport system permease protein
MWLRLRIAIVKELISYLRDPATRRFLIGAPIFQTIVFAYAATLDVRNIDVAILDQDNGRWSHELVARVDAAWFTDDIVTTHDGPTMERLISERQVLIGLRLDPGFSRDVTAGRTATVQLIADGRRANSAQIAASYIGSLLEELSVDIDPQYAGGVPEIRGRHWFNSNLNYRWFMVANLSAVMAMMLCLVITSLSIAREREMGTFDQLLVSPMTATEIILAKTVPGLLSGVVVSLLITGIAVFVFGAPYTGNPLLLPFALSLFVLSVVGFGLLISSICNTQQQAIMGTFFSTIPFVLTSGFATPTENMPLWLQQLSEINPLKHYILVVQGSFFKSHGAAEVLPNLLPLLPIAVVTLTVASLVVRRRLQ